MKRVVLVVVLVAGLSGCGSSGAVDLGAASHHVPAATYPAMAVAGLPPVGARPSTPPTGACLTTSSISLPVPVTHSVYTYYVYTDGRMIWQKWTPAGAPLIIPKFAHALTTGYVQQQLTPRGARLLKAKIHATGHFHPRRLPASAWEDESIQPYTPSHYTISHERAAVDPTRLPHPAGAALAQYTEFLRDGHQTITLNQAIALAHAFLKAGIPSQHLPGGTVEFLFGETMWPNSNIGDMMMTPTLPHATTTHPCPGQYG